jgi:phage-related protein
MKIDKPLRWLHGEVKSPPFTPTARLEIGWLLRRLQEGENLSLPHSRPLPSIGSHCHELRVRDKSKNWRLIYRIDDDRVLIVEVFNKTTRQIPDEVMTICKKRLSDYDKAKQREGSAK